VDFGLLICPLHHLRIDQAGHLPYLSDKVEIIGILHLPVYTYQLTNQHEISHRPTQTDTDKDIHKKSVNYFCALMNDAKLFI
jgi:hypothetical protein